MDQIIDHAITHLDAFDREGLHVGTAELTPRGWLCMADSPGKVKTTGMCDSEKNARVWLQSLTRAVRIEEGDGHVKGNQR